MSDKEAFQNALKETVLPELAVLKQDQVELKASLSAAHQRLDDINTHLVDQSRRIDAQREELGRRLDGATDKISRYIDQTNGRLGDIVGRLDQIYQVVMRLEEKQDLALRLTRVEEEMAELKKRLAATSAEQG